MSLTNVKAQPAPMIPFIANPTNQPPTINGQWEPEEWGNAMVYNLTVGAYNVRPRPTVRLLHDNASLYGLVDVPSDNGGTYVGSSGKPDWGFVSLTFYYGTVYPGGPTPSKAPWFWFIIDTNQTRLARTSIVYYPSSNSTIVNEGILTWKHSSASTSLTTTSLSKEKHRIWEFSVQVFPYIVHRPLTQNGTNIGFDVDVWDSGGNAMEFVGASQPGRLFFVNTPIPEVASTVLVLPVVILGALVLFRQRRKP